MKFTQFAAVAAFAGLANAQSACLSSALAIPTCALGYIASYAHNSLGCGLVDFNCYCSSSNFAAISATALADANSGAPSGCDVASAAAAGQNLCNCASANSGQSAVLTPAATQCENLAADIQPCALGLIVEQAQSFGCGFNDLACQCSNFMKIEGAVANSINPSCGPAGFDAVSQASSLCDCVASAPADSPNPGPTTTTGGANPPAAGPTNGGSQTNVAPKPTTTPKSSSGGSPVNKPTTSGGSSIPKQSPSGSISLSHFTNAGATAGALGGAVGVIAGLVAML